MDSYLVLRGNQNVHLRMQGIVRTRVAAYLIHPKQNSLFSGSKTHPFHEIAKSKHDARGMVSLILFQEARCTAFLEKLQPFILAESLGGGGILSQSSRINDARINW
jgi:cystathionine beta-lyase/cystathionine gamma-synthase